MELWFFELNWKEYEVHGKHRVIVLEEMLKRTRGISKIGGYFAISFEPMSPDVDRIVLSISETGGEGTYCVQWDEDYEKWINLGKIYPRPEWGRYHFSRNWQSCAIRFAGSQKEVPLKDIFAECLGEELDGVLFVGKGKLDGERFLLRLDREKRLRDYYDDQRCEIFSKKTDEWEFWGTLVKYPPK